jgi:ATP synthase protein I
MSDPADERGPGRGEMSPEERAAFKARVSDLDGKLGKVRAERQAGRDADQGSGASGRGMAYGMRMAAELVSAIIVGGLIGYALDWWLGTKPWLFLLFFVLGFAGGVLNVLRAYERMQKDYMDRTGGRIGHSVPDDED